MRRPNHARWRRAKRRQFPDRIDPPFTACRFYTDYEWRSGVFPHDKLTVAFQNAVSYPPLKRLGSEPNGNGNRHCKWIPEFEYKLLYSLCARSRAVYNLYILQKKPARTIADGYGWGFLSQNDVYVLAGKLKKLIEAHYDNKTDYDWQLAWMLAEEGASDDVIVEIIKCKPQTFRKKQLSTGRSRSQKKRLDADTVKRIKRKLALGCTCSDIATEFGVWPSTIRSIKEERWHKDVTI